MTSVSDTVRQPSLKCGWANTYLIATAYLSHLWRQDKWTVERVVRVGSPLLWRLVILLLLGSRTFLCGLLLWLGLRFWLGFRFWLGTVGCGSFSRCRLRASSQGCSGGGSSSVTTSHTTETWKSKATGGWCRRSTIVRGRRLWWRRHAFRNLIEAVTDDLVDLLFTCREIESGWESVWWKLCKLCANLLCRDGAEVGAVKDLDDGRAEEGDDRRVERTRLRHDGGKRRKKQARKEGEDNANEWAGKKREKKTQLKTDRQNSGCRQQRGVSKRKRCAKVYNKELVS